MKREDMGVLNLTLIAGARPNFMKVAPLIHAIERHNVLAGVRPIHYRLVHTGQHYDTAMSATFFARWEEHTSELPSHSENSYAVFCLKKQI